MPSSPRQNSRSEYTPRRRSPMSSSPGDMELLVLCYHAVTERWPNELSVDPEALERQVRLLLRRGYRGVRFAEVTSDEGPSKRFAITFDDAYRSVCDEAAPVLERLGVPATVFVPTAWVGADEPMSW